MIEEELLIYLKAHAGLSALVSTRIYGGEAPQGIAKPYLVYTREDTDKEYSHDGYSSLQRIYMYLQCYGSGYLSAKQVSDQVVAAIHAWPAANANIQAAFIEDVDDAYVESIGLYVAPVTAVFWYGV